MHLYEEHGADCVRHLHGMFGLAVWDTTRRRLLLARDRIGKKPVYYALRRNALSFGSELSAVLADAEVDRALDHSRPGLHTSPSAGCPARRRPSRPFASSSRHTR